MQTNDVKLYHHAHFGDIRTFTDDHGEPWFVAKDVCNALALANVGQALARLDNDEKNTVILNDGNPGNPSKTAVNEPGLYSLILASRKKEAKTFKRWVTHEVLPSIRRHGGYLSPAKLEEALLNPDTLIQLATSLKAEREKNRELSARIEADRPKILFAQALTTSKHSILVGELAKVLKINGVEIGQNRLFKWLRENGYLHSRGEQRNLPTQKSVELDLFELKVRTIDDPDGSIRVIRTTKVTGKGQQYFINKFLKGAA